MKIHAIGTRFADYRQYCSVADAALAVFPSPLMNSLPLARDARRLIDAQRLFYVRNQDHLLLLSAHVGYYKLYYIARENAVLRLPPVDLPVVCYQAQTNVLPCPQCGELLEASGFARQRVSLCMEKALDDGLRQEPYLPGKPPRCAMPDKAMTGEYYKIHKLLSAAFHPLLDALPGRDELMQGIIAGHVYVIRDEEKIAAVMLSSPRGAVAAHLWLAVDFAYRGRGLSGLLHWYGDQLLKKHGIREASVWINGQDTDWIRVMERRGYRLCGQRMATYVFLPQEMKI